MTTVDAGSDRAPDGPAARMPDLEEPLTPEVLPSPLRGDPLLLALGTFAVGAVGLGLYLWGYIPAGSMLAVLGIVAGLGVGISAIWAAAIGQSAVAGILGVFAGFYSSFPILVLGLTHGWWGIDATNSEVLVRTQATFLISFLVLFIAITLTTLRLFRTFTILMVVVDITVVIVLLGVINGSAGLLQVGAIGVWAFTAIALYIWAGQMSVGTGGKPLALGKPILT